MTSTTHQNLTKYEGTEDAADILDDNVDNMEEGRQFYINEAGENLTDLDPVCIKEADDKFYKCDANDTALLDFRGLSNGAITSGNDGHGYGLGAIVTEATWTWDMDKLIFVDDSKALSQTAGTYGIIAGIPLQPTIMMVLPITLKFLRTHIADPAACAAVTATTVDLTNMDDGSANNTLVAIGDTSAGNESGNIEKNFDKIGDEINALKADADAQKTAIDANNAAIDSILVVLEKLLILAES